MIDWGYYDREHLERTGRFKCPQCLEEGECGIYGVFRHNWISVAFIPVFSRAERVGEIVRCHSCDAALPITVLAVDAPTVTSAQDCEQGGKVGINANLGNVVKLTEAAAREILRRLFCGKFPRDSVARIQPPESAGSGYGVTFDYALADGSDWLGESHGIGIVVSRRDVPSLLGRTIDFREGRFRDAPE